MALCQPSRDGRRLASSCDGCYMLHLDAEKSGDWHAFKAALDAAGLSYVLGRSVSSTPAEPRWHAHIPLVGPVRRSALGWRARFAWTIGVFEVLAGFRGPRFGGASGQGFDPAVDNPMQPVFPGSRRSAETPTPEVVWTDTGKALDLDRFLELTGFDVERARAVLVPPPVEREGRATREASPARTVRPASVGDDAAPLVRAFSAAVWLGEWRRGAWQARCPFYTCHTGAAGEMDARLFEDGRWYCPHRACSMRTRREVVEALPERARLLLERAEEGRGFERMRARLAAAPRLEVVPLDGISDRVIEVIREALARETASREGAA